jgi:hypothetical protein
MRRPIHRFGLLAALAIGLFWLAGAFTDPPPGKTTTAANPGKEKDPKETRAGEWERKLATFVTLTLEPTPFKEALDHLSEKYGLTILVDRGAFQNDLNIADVEGQQVKLGKVAGLRLETVLKKLTAQVQGSFLVKGDYLEITTLGRVQATVWGQVNADETAPGSGKPRPRMPLVKRNLAQQSLDAVLRSLTEATGITILLDSRRIGDKGQTLVTGHFRNVPLDTAVRLLANQADLKMVLLDNCLYVTTADHAGSLQPETPPVTPGLNPGAAAPLQKTVSLKLEGTPLQKVLQDLGRETGVKVVLDPQVGRAAQTAITLDLEGVTVDTALRLVTEMAELKPIAVGNVMFVTTHGKADKLEAERAKDLNLSMQMMKDSGVMIGLGGLSGGGGIMGINAGFGGGGLIGFGGSFGGAAGPPIRIGTFPPPVKAELPQRPLAKAETPLRRLLTTLARPITLDKGIEANTPLNEALAMFQDRYELPILVDEEAFKNDLNQQDVTNQPVKLPRLTGVRLGTVLDKLLAQVQGAYLVKADHVEVTTAQRARAAVWGQIEMEEEDPAAGSQRLRMPVVHADLANLPLQAALSELADSTGMSVMVDHHRVGDKAQALVSGPLTNVPLDTAVRLLADQVELAVVVLDNVLYVTTPANARLIQAEQARANQRGMESGPGPGAGPPNA